MLQSLQAKIFRILCLLQIHSIKFNEFNRGSEPESRPTSIKVFMNRCNLGFEDVGDVEPTQSFDLTEEDLKLGADPVLTKFVKFQRVSSITLFIEDNDGGDVSALGGLKLIGKPVATTNMSEFKAQKG